MNKVTDLKAIIVDDEISAINNLSILLKDFCPEIGVIGTAQSVDEAFKLIEQKKPDIVFLDIEMPQKTGFELLKKINQTIQIVFVTAYNDYAVKAFEVSAVDYLLKPVSIKRLKKTAKKLKQNKAISRHQLDVVRENLEKTHIQKFVLPYRNAQIIINLESIICLEASAMYTKFYYTEQGNYTTKLFSKSLKHYTDYLADDKRFFRTHRSWLVRKESIIKFDKGTRMVVLENDLQVPLSRSNIKEYHAWLKS